jgi:hypothetical protein
LDGSGGCGRLDAGFNFGFLGHAVCKLSAVVVMAGRAEISENIQVDERVEIAAAVVVDRLRRASGEPFDSLFISWYSDTIIHGIGCD